MWTLFSQFLDLFENVLWSYFGVPLVIGLGLFLTLKANFFQIRHLPTIFRTFFSYFFSSNQEHSENGVHPIKAFFAAVGGCVGIGNIVGICTAVQLGGPGALFWIWMTALAGMIIKYSEVYLGILHRVPNGQGGYRGGPMFFLKKAFGNSWIPSLVCVLLCIYGVEVYQFSVVTNSISTNFDVDPYLVIAAFLILVVFAGSGGVQRVGNISSKILPAFVVVYVSMGLWVLINNVAMIPSVFKEVFISAFSGHAALGGFAGAGIMTAMSHGIRRCCYATDVGVGYASVMHSESSSQIPEKQASLAIFDIFLDSFVVCTTSLLIILTTGIWHQPLSADQLVQTVLGNYFPYMHVFIPIFLFLLGYNTINAYFCVGVKCAEFLSPRWGKSLFFCYAITALPGFALMGGVIQAQSMMAVAGVSLLIINSVGIFLLRDEISFNLPPEKAVAPNIATVPQCETSLMM